MTLPPCATAATHPPSHRALAALQVTAQPDNFTMRVCTLCLWDVIQTLREGGYHTISVTAPEQPQLVAHR